MFRFEDIIKIDFTKMGYTIMNCLSQIHNRTKSRDFVNTEMNICIL